MRVLVLGGYGLIGAEIARALLGDGFDVVGLGRDADFGRRILPQIEWIGADIAKLATPADWKPHLKGVDAVVNASGALQNGARDRLVAVQDDAIRALIAAAKDASVKIFVQISAPGAEAHASTAFLRTKASADAVLRASGLDWVIFKPGLVISRNAYGATALLRMLAGFPRAAPLVLPEARLQTVAADDVARAVAMALKRGAPLRVNYDLAEQKSRSLREVTLLFRRWLGLPERAIVLPPFAGRVVATIADLAGLLGWRSALRSTSMKVLSENITADGAPWTKATGMTFKSLEGVLSEMPATAQERVFARVALILPILIVVLALYWIASGAVGFIALESAASHLFAVAERRLATALVGAASAVDIVIGAGLLIKATARPFALISVAVAVLYLAAGSVIAPELWMDPLGVLIKVIPVIALGATVALLMTDR